MSASAVVVKPFHRLSARAALYRAIPPDGIAYWSSQAVENTVAAVALALAGGNVVVLRRVGAGVAYEVREAR